MWNAATCASPRRPTLPAKPFSPHRAAVLPHRLHGAVAPPVALLPQLRHGGGRLGPGPCALLEHHAPPGPAERDREVGVLGQRVGGHAADLQQRLAAERAARAGHGDDRARDVLHAAVDVEADHVLDVLHPADELVAVGDLDVARDGADRRIGERLGEQAHRVGLEHGVAVDHDDDLVLGGPDARVQRLGLAGVLLPQHPHVRDARGTPPSPGVPSVEPSSTTSTSSGWSLATMDRTVASMFLISL